jgi:ParB-like chromosome segregation protein Spo0J
MSREELIELGEDIKKNGMKVPIALIAAQGGGLMLLDGRNRLDAMEAAGLRIARIGNVLRTVLPHDTDCFAYAISANLHRRHLTADQKT